MKFTRVLLRVIFSITMLLIAHSIFAQQQPEEDFISEGARSKVYHYIGLQGNQLIRQLFNFGGSIPAITNPYLLVYSVNSKKSGFGVSTGLGGSKIQTKTSDNFTTTTSTVNDFSWRIGIEKKTYLSKRWLVGFGADALVETNKTETESKSGNTTNPTVTSTSKRFGFGPRASIAFHLHDRVLLGTEASYYFKWIKQKQKVSGPGVPTTTNNEPNPSLQQFSFTLPAVIFIMVKL
jgi:hypothetical protein